MTKIKLQSIALHNFKGTRYLLLNLLGKDCNIIGANGSGKTTVYKAYYWCLTGKTLEPNEIVQVLDEHNEVIHKIETSVTVTLVIDDSYEVCMERKLVEEWKALGQPNEELKGTKQLRYWNDVPLSAKEFDAKLASVCNVERWLLLSDITKFMSLKTDDRRKLLLSMAGEVNEEELMKPYPELLKAVSEKKTIDELKIQSLSTKKRSTEELKTIPSQISAQDALRNNENFPALKAEKAQLDIQIADIDKVMQGSTEELAAVKDYNDRVAKAEEALAKFKKEWNDKRNADAERLRKTINSLQSELNNAQSVADKHKQDNEARIQQKIALMEEFQKIRQEWEIENNTTFLSKEEYSCPLCGHKFTDEERAENRARFITEFNRKKSDVLKRLQTAAELKNQQILVLTGSINEYNKAIRPSDENALRAKETALKQAQSEYDAVMKLEIENHARFIELKEAHENTVAEKPTTQYDVLKETNEAKRRELWSKRDSIIEKLAGEQTNLRIEEEKVRLEARSKDLAQIIADCDKVLWEISEYRKAKVNAVESKVNSFFSLARWKFYEKNVSNDDLQEVCICHHNGVDYNSTNGADRINLGVDIIAGLSKAYDMQVPLFIDNAESVADVIETDNQKITLTHVPYAEFSLNNNI